MTNNIKNCFIFWTLVVCFAPNVQAFWGDDVVPRLRVNYLSQTSGKKNKFIKEVFSRRLEDTENPCFSALSNNTFHVFCVKVYMVFFLPFSYCKRGVAQMQKPTTLSKKPSKKHLRCLEFQIFGHDIHLIFKMFEHETRYQYIAVDSIKRLAK